MSKQLKKLRILLLASAVVFALGAVPVEAAVFKEEPVAEVGNPGEIAGELSAGEAVSVSVPAGETVYYSITPGDSDIYIFESGSDGDTYARLYDSDWVEINRNDDGGENYNFKIRQALEKGKTYYLGVKFYSSEKAGEMPVFTSIETAKGQIKENTEITEKVPGGEIFSYSFVPEKNGYFGAVTSGNVAVGISNSEGGFIYDNIGIGETRFYYMDAESPCYITVRGKDFSTEESFSLKVVPPVPSGELEAPGNLDTVVKTSTDYYYLIHADKDMDAEISAVFDTEEDDFTSYMELMETDWRTPIPMDSYSEGAAKQYRRCSMEAGKDYVLKVLCFGQKSLTECGISIKINEFSSYPVIGSLTEGEFKEADAGDTYSFVPAESGEYYLNRVYSNSSEAYGEIYDSEWKLLASESILETVPSVDMEAGKTYYVRIRCPYTGGWEITVERYHEPYFLDEPGNIEIEQGSYGLINAKASAIGPVYKWEQITEEGEDKIYNNDFEYWVYGAEYNDGKQYRCTVTDVKGVELVSNIITCDVILTEEVTVTDETSGVELVFLKREDGTAALTGYQGMIDGNVVIPDQVDGCPVTDIRRNAFINAGGLTGITIPDTVTQIGEGAFLGTGLRSLTLPEGLAKIGAYAFVGDSYLTTIKFPESLKTIGVRAFAECIALRAVSFKKNLSLLDYGAFQNSTGISDVYYEGTEAEWNRNVEINESSNTDILSADYHFGEALPEEKVSGDYRYIVKADGTAAVTGYTGGAEADIPAELDGCAVTEIAGAAFAGTAVTDVTVPDSVVTIGSGAFKDCRALTDVSLSASLTELGREVFSSCTALEEISLPDSLAVIPEAAFYSCLALKSVKLPADLTEIGKKAFMNDTALASVEFPESLAKIGDQAFKYCSALTAAEVPAGVGYITFEAFFGCEKLETLLLPGAAKIQQRAFAGCANLASVEFKNVLATVHDGAFCEDEALKDIYFTGTEERWKAVDIWKGNEPLLAAQVHFKAVVPESIVLDQETLTVKTGEEAKLTAEVLPEDAENKAVVWTSSDETVATVDADGNVTAVREGKADIIATTVDGGLTAVCKVEVEKKITFNDVANTESWYYDAVYWAVANNVTSGMGEGTFQPTVTLSRAQAVMFLYKLAGQPDVSDLPEIQFSDVKESNWYYKAVRWAVANEITTGYGTGTFKPGDACNRAMIVTFLMRYSKIAGTYAAPASGSNFKDVPAGAWYKEAVDWAVASGVTTGMGEGTFQPKRTCNRAMMVTFLKRVAELPKQTS